MPLSGDDVKALRKKAGMTQDEFAKALGYATRLTVLSWEKERFAPPNDLVERVAAISPGVIIDAAKVKASAKVADETFFYYDKWRRQGSSHASFMERVKDPAKTELATNRELQARLVEAWPDILNPSQEG